MEIKHGQKLQKEFETNSTMCIMCTEEQKTIYIWNEHLK